MNLLELTLAQKKQMEKIRIESGVQTSAMSFNMAYIWRDIFHHKVYITEDAYVLKYGICGSDAWLMPVGSDTGKRRMIEELLKNKNTELYMVSEQDQQFLNQYFPGQFVFEECPDDSDYIYDIQEQCEQSGKKYGSMRRIWNHYRKNYNIASEPLSEKNMDIAYDIIRDWRRDRVMRGSANIVGDESDYLVLQEYTTLGYEGIIIRLNGIPTSVIIGYELTADTFDGVVAKVRGDYSSFSYVTKYLFLMSLRNRYRYFNAEPDLGIQGLRKNKLAMKPCRMNRLWKARMK